jgi:hypothetical protein
MLRHAVYINSMERTWSDVQTESGWARSGTARTRHLERPSPLRHVIERDLQGWGIHWSAILRVCHLLTMLPAAGIRLYARYKANSKDLFTTIRGWDLSELEKWSGEKVLTYQRWLCEGYVRNSICFGARRSFREKYVPEDQRDEGHNNAIRSAEENCATFVRLYRNFRLALSRTNRRTPDSDELAVGPASARLGEQSIIATNHDASPHLRTAVTEYDDTGSLMVAWEAAMKERAEKETEIERFVAELYERAEVALRNLKVKDNEVIPILDNLLRALAPSPSVGWDWGNPQAIEILVKRGPVTDEKLAAMVLQAAVEHRKFERSLGCMMPPPWSPPKATDPASAAGKNMVTLLFIIGEACSQMMAGRHAWSLTHLIALRECCKHFATRGELRNVRLRNPPSQRDYDAGGKACLAELLTRPLPIEPSTMTQKAAWTAALRLWKGIVTRHFTGSDPMPFLNCVLVTFAKVLEGTVDFTLALIHPAKFLSNAAILPSADSLVASAKLLRECHDGLISILREIYEVLAAARNVFDLQYYSEYETYYTTGRMPPSLALKNPFEDDDENVLCQVTRMMKSREML